MVIGFLIYLEIVIIKCCGLNKNTRKEISQRSKLEEVLGQNSLLGIQDLNSDGQTGSDYQ